MIGLFNNVFQENKRDDYNHNSCQFTNKLLNVINCAYRVGSGPACLEK